MYIPNRILATCYRLITAAISGLAVFFIVHGYGVLALRLFPTWVALIAAVYFLSSGVATYFSVHRKFSQAICPTLQGALLISGFTLLVLHVICLSYGISLPSSSGLIGTLVNFILPLLFLFDWLLFSEKGFWRPIDPFYWLVLPVSFIAVSLIIIHLSSVTDNERFVYPFLDYAAIGLDTMLWYFGIAATLILIFGYLCFILDFATSGRLGKYIVLPKIKTIVIEEDIDEDSLQTNQDETGLNDMVVKPKATGSDEVQALGDTKNTKDTKAVEQIKDTNDIDGTYTNDTENSKATSSKNPRNKANSKSKSAKTKAKSTAKAGSSTKPKKSQSTKNPQKSSKSQTSVQVKIGDLKDEKSAKHLHDSGA